MEQANLLRPTLGSHALRSLEDALKRLQNLLKGGIVSAMQNVRLHAYFSGSVQGVFFRSATVKIARRFEITGWVRNLFDGRVELLAEGGKRTLLEFINELLRYPNARVTDQVLEWLEATGEYVSFEKI